MIETEETVGYDGLTAVARAIGDLVATQYTDRGFSQTQISEKMIEVFQDFDQSIQGQGDQTISQSICSVADAINHLAESVQQLKSGE